MNWLWMYFFLMDRYHAVMANFFLGDNATTPTGDMLGEEIAVYYLTQRKCRYGPVIGHGKLFARLANPQLDEPHAEFLRKDRACLTRLAARLLRNSSFRGKIKGVKQGTIMFAGVPFMYVEGKLWEAHLIEVAAIHAFDLTITVAYNAMEMCKAAGKKSPGVQPFMSVFSLRRDGDVERSAEVTKAAIIGGFDDTSDMEAAFRLGVASVGTMAHYLVMAFIMYMHRPERDASGKKKHFQQVAYERWLDDNPNGTILLIDTIIYLLGIKHAILAAMSSEKRRKAFKGIRIDSGDLIESARFCRKLLDKHGFQDVGIILTGDLDAEKIAEIVAALDFPIMGFGVGTKLAAEIRHVAGVIFKLCEIAGIPVMKLSDTAGKETNPGQAQVWRCYRKDEKSGKLLAFKDVVALESEEAPTGEGIVKAVPLLVPLWGYEEAEPFEDLPALELKESVRQQEAEFVCPLDQYPIERSEQLKSLIKQVADSMMEDEGPELDMNID